MMHDYAIMREAARLARDGEIGNSDVIRLLQMPHRAEDLEEILCRFDKCLTKEARSKLALYAFAPLPEHVDNQRYEPIFDRYPISGKTYTTGSGAVVPNEVQYYNGQMLQLYGESDNLSAVSAALAGSGYRPLTLKRADGSVTAVTQLWAHRLTDTSLRPYNAMFIVVAAIAVDAPPDQWCMTADENGASSALAMLNGSYDATKFQYRNSARLFFLRLLDTTRVAIDVGRERMGTDKRPGSIDLIQEGRHVAFKVKDKAGNLVARGDAILTEDATAYLVEIARAAATAGIPLATLPAGTEYVYPAVARIGQGPVVTWQWRTDIVPRFQAAKSSMVACDASSEEGAILLEWGFTPKVMGYLPNVRGAITGIPDAPSPTLSWRP